MRLIGTFDSEKEVYTFHSFLLKEGIQNVYDSSLEGETGVRKYRVWVYEEDDLPAAMEWLQAYTQDPSDSRFHAERGSPGVPPQEVSTAKGEELWDFSPPPPPTPRPFAFLLTHLIILLCGALFLWNDFQEAFLLKSGGELAVQIAMTPLQQELLFDSPSAYSYIKQLVETVPLSAYKELSELPPDALALLKQAENTPSWQGIYPFFQSVRAKGWEVAKRVPMFEKIAQGQFWRLFTPCLMHRDFLHILFNMVWVWILAKQIEERMRKWQMGLLILIIGIISNVAQYLVSGPYFLGFSGVVVGMAGFIWVRQKRVPWEGYPLQRSTALFLLFFVVAMCAIELIMFTLHAFSVIGLSPNIANTAHVVGGATGMLLGRFSWFARRGV